VLLVSVRELRVDGDTTARASLDAPPTAAVRVSEAREDGFRQSDVLAAKPVEQTMRCASST
jgi:hypothetical protein